MSEITTRTLAYGAGAARRIPDVSVTLLFLERRMAAVFYTRWLTGRQSTRAAGPRAGGGVQSLFVREVLCTSAFVLFIFECSHPCNGSLKPTIHQSRPHSRHGELATARSHRTASPRAASHYQPPLHQRSGAPPCVSTPLGNVPGSAADEG
ncbi:hypothetical protein AAFF_G00165190 [Aldrovandia affinis]|uniref:Uncharacterized protein n=1 Tax=Aldrovandia affinis TaxID=143900 RepID=A0AAD7W7Q4_9TELE|nr:hypothetical protein AAFF_G00165190 [Aldrovandia affinis]